MTPNDLDAYLQVITRNKASQISLKLGDGIEIHAVFLPEFVAKPGAEPEPGGWKTMTHLDNPADLREDSTYKGDLP